MFLIIMLDVKKKRYGFRKDMEGEECPMQMIIEPKRFLHKTSSHLYVQPHPFLKKAVAHYTILQESAYTGQETLLLVPDISGCIVFKVKKNTIDAQYWGPTTKLVEVQAEPDDAYFSFFIEFHQGGAYQLFQRGLQELLDEKIPLSKILPELQEQMIEAYMQSTTLEMFLAKIDSILLSGERKDSHIVTMLRKQMHPQVSLKEVGNAIGYSERHVQRIFLEQVIKSYSDSCHFLTSSCVFSFQPFFYYPFVKELLPEPHSIPTSYFLQNHGKFSSRFSAYIPHDILP